MSEPIKYTVEVKAEDSHMYPDMRLRMLIRTVVVNAHQNELKPDEVLRILEDEVYHLRGRIKEQL